MKSAIATAAHYSCSSPGLTQNNYLTEPEVRKDWQRVVLPFAKVKVQLAEIARVTPQAVVHWYNGDRSPSVTSLFNLARSLPSIQMWGAENMGISRSADCMSINEIERALHVIGARDDEEGRIARKMLVACYAIREGSEQVIPPMVRMAWNLIDERTLQSDRDTNTIDLFANSRS